MVWTRSEINRFTHCIMQIGIVGDLHFYPGKDEHWIQTYDELGDWIVSEFKRKGVKWIVFAGDVFHGHVAKTTEKAASFQVLAGITRFFQKFSDFQIIVLLGNHDCFYKDDNQINGIRILDGWDNIRVVDEAPDYLYITQKGAFFGNEDDDIPIKKYGIAPWGTGVKDIPECDVLFGHFDIQSFNYNAHQVSQEGFRSEQLFRKAKKIVTGHYHQYQTRSYKKGDITYVGSPLQHNWGERGKDSFIFTIDTDTDELHSIENKISPKHVALSYSKIKSVDLKKEIPGNLVKFSFDKECSEANIDKVDQILSALKPKTLVKTFDNNIAFESGFTEATDSIDIWGTIEEFIGLMDVEKKEAIVKKLKTLYDANK